MTHDEILRAARERIAAIDKQTTDLATERAKLVAMVAASGNSSSLPKMSEPPRTVYVPTPYPVYPEPYRPVFPYGETWITTTPYAYDPNRECVLLSGTTLHVQTGTAAGLTLS